ncbi:NAD(P)H-dependent glycerol-3-phosphate dehydrogenase [Pelorhabdus rhamnosifermentans]|uniref:NAD(P)H-dependent glycerol-3-phosphate dehydrogenase n=1 Tax=Pelorhabdus rhamnosifermentans TaxID=2772457 RepID=UPI0028ADD6A1|nr:NAD(P)H-dependent glycerol-3-phosphate dehydrogenase [Pelorhabdus rhamnosifermentans]
MSLLNIAVIGAGSWGTALSKLLSEKYSSVTLWARSAEFVQQLCETRENKTYLPGIFLPKRLIITDQIKEAVSSADVIFFVTPSHILRTLAKKAAPFVRKQALLVSAAKGFELSTYKRMSEILAEEFPQHHDKIAALSGPNHAEEVGLNYPATTVIASPHRAIAEQIQDLLMTCYFRAYTNPDMIGVELGGALKNIIALGAGIAEGLGFGDNTKSALMTRGLTEIARLGVTLGANAFTFSGLSGVGDLIATCTSKHSRNRRAGLLIATGKTAHDIQQNSKMVVEGIRATQAAYELSQRYHIEMPITEQIYAVLYQNKNSREAVLELMTRGKTHELEEVVQQELLWK